jgi:hypothetical protein
VVTCITGLQQTARQEVILQRRLEFADTRLAPERLCRADDLRRVGLGQAAEHLPVFPGNKPGHRVDDW